MSLQACADLVARGDPDRWRAAMAAPVAAREKLFPIYALNVEVARAPWVTSEPQIAEIRLQWWREALDEIAAWGTVRRHEVTTPLAEIVDADGAAILDRLVSARRWDVYREPFEEEAHFQEYIDATAGGLMWASARALGAPAAFEEAVRQVGRAAGLAAFFQAVPALRGNGRQPLLDDSDGAIKTLCEQSLEGLSASRTGTAGLPPLARAALLAGWQAKPLLKKAKHTPGLVRNGGLMLTEIHKRGLLLWRAL